MRCRLPGSGGNDSVIDMGIVRRRKVDVAADIPARRIADIPVELDDEDTRSIRAAEEDLARRLVQRYKAALEARRTGSVVDGIDHELVRRVATWEREEMDSGLRVKVPQLILTGSSSRKLKREGVDLLAGRALVRSLHPFMAAELGDRFRLDSALTRGLVPLVWSSPEPEEVLKAYVALYLREEVQMEGLVRRSGGGLIECARGSRRRIAGGGSFPGCSTPSRAP